MREGADIVLVIAHSGLSADPYHSMAENSVYYLSEVPGVDAIMFGHAHAVFPVKILPTSKARISPKVRLAASCGNARRNGATIWKWSITVAQ